MRSADAIRAAVAAAALAGALLAAAVPAAVLGAEPSPTRAGAGDPRSAGEGPGLVGDPIWAIGLVLAIALVALLASLAYVRMTARRGGGPPA